MPKKSEFHGLYIKFPSSFFSCRLVRHSNLQRILHGQSNRKNARLTKKPQTFSSVAEFFAHDLPYKETICFGSMVGNTALF
jgi:hypothetical protein